MADRPPIGAVIREARRAMGYTQAGLASLCDITPQYLSLLELGEVNVSLDTLMAICVALDEPLSSLVVKAEELQAGQRRAAAAQSRVTARSKKSDPSGNSGKSRTVAARAASGKAPRKLTTKSK